MEITVATKWPKVSFIIDCLMLLPCITIICYFYRLVNNKESTNHQLTSACAGGGGGGQQSSNSHQSGISVSKPPYTYTELIEQALSEKGPLTVAEIYRWIS